MTDFIKQMRKGIAEMCVLGAIERHNTYGYELVRQLSTLETLALTESTVYPLLSRLRRAGFVRVYEAESPEGPTRRYFALTVEGRLRLEAMRSYWGQLSEDIETFWREDD